MRPSATASLISRFDEAIRSTSTIFHCVVDAESDGPLEAVLGCPETVIPTALVGIRTEPAHEEAYTTITKAAQLAYPAILAAYDAVAAPLNSRPDSAAACHAARFTLPSLTLSATASLSATSPSRWVPKLPGSGSPNGDQRQRTRPP